MYLLGFQKNSEELTYYEAFIEQADVRKMIHVGNLTFNNGSAAKKHLISVNSYEIRIIDLFILLLFYVYRR